MQGKHDQGRFFFESRKTYCLNYLLYFFGLKFAKGFSLQMAKSYSSENNLLHLVLLVKYIQPQSKKSAKLRCVSIYFFMTTILHECQTIENKPFTEVLGVTGSVGSSVPVASSVRPCFTCSKIFSEMKKRGLLLMIRKGNGRY